VWKRFAVIGLVCALVVAMSTIALPYHASHDSPPPICEHVDLDDLDEQQLVTTTPASLHTPQPRVIVTSMMISTLQLAPVIFQPPETA